MNPTFRHTLYKTGAVVLFFCLTGVSVRAQEAADGPKDLTVVKQQAAPNTEAAGSTPVPGKKAADYAKELALSASSASTAAPVSFLAPPRLTPPGKRIAPDTAVASSRAQAASSDKWQFMVAPYLWLAGLSGTVGVGDLTTDIDPSASDLLNALNFGFMGIFEARKNRFMLVTDLMYISLEETKDTSGPLFSALKAEVKTFMLSPVVGYRLVDKEGGSVDALVGIRFWHTSTRLELEPGLLAGRVGESSKNWADVIAGLRGQAHLSKAFSLIGRGDVGGGGSDLTYQLFGGLGINLSESASLFAGYRYLYFKYTRGESLFDGALKGVVLGAAFRF
jgi:hypothetical protein